MPFVCKCMLAILIKMLTDTHRNGANEKREMKFVHKKFTLF